MTSESQYLKPRPEALKKIKHIVVLMMENRSFDNLLGWLYDGETPPRGQEFEGLHAGLWNPLDNRDANAVEFIEQIYVQKNGEPSKISKSEALKSSTPEFTLPKPDPGEGYKDTNHQLFQYYDAATEFTPQPTNLGFVNDYASAMMYGTYAYGDSPADPRRIMICYTPEQVPVLSTLAKQFAVCDKWFCSVPSQTLPNRDFVHAATSCGQVNNKPSPDCDARTIFNQIQDAITENNRKDLSWKVYSGTQQARSKSKGKPSSAKEKPVWEPFSLTRLIMTKLHDSAFNPNFVNIKNFYRDAAKGNLPSYSFLEPQFSGQGQNDQHPPSDIRPGEQLIADVYNAVVNSPQWKETMLIITYDEHGGSYDHFPPPGRAKPPDGTGTPGQFGFRFDRFGVRVPTVVISPYIEAGTICRPAGYTPFDHTSIIATVRNCFGLYGSLTERDKAAPDLSCALTLPKARMDKPKVQPLPFKKAGEEEVTELHKTIETALCQLTGQSRPEDQDIHDFNQKVYEDHFASQKEP
ncbi:MAG TPA: alkaline phosphatase family protein [Pyrinomonadaceae bacterium]|nr:alkaline phosphatase family protein [Pyrinomonadaceae bacterium]